MVKHTQTIRRQEPINCLSVSDHFLGLALKNKKAFYFTGKALSVLEVFRTSHFSLPFFFLLLAIAEFIREAD